MNLDDAIAECQRWLESLERQKARSEALQNVASDLRARRIDHDQARRREIKICGFGPKVYDGAELKRAVEFLIEEVGGMSEAGIFTWDSWQEAVGSPEWIWPNFTPEEMAGREGKLVVRRVTMDALQGARSACGWPFNATCGTRLDAHNQAVGGGELSMHLFADAVDISTVGWTESMRAVFERAVRERGFNAVVWYKLDRFVHIDMGRERTWTTA